MPTLVSLICPSLQILGKTQMGVFLISKARFRGISANFGIPDFPQSPDIGQNSDEGISDFQSRIPDGLILQTS